MSQNYNILCCDGGGIRGLLTAMLLDRLPPSALQNTMLFAGTSTGGIIAIALAVGIPPKDLVGLYSSQCSTIFPPNAPPAASVDQMTAYIKSVLPSDLAFTAEALALACEVGILPKNLFSAKYANASLRTQIEKTLGGSATTTFDKVPSGLFVTTYQLDDGGGEWLPISIDNLPGSTTSASALIDAALSTSAAPTFFPPYNHPLLGYCVDGGTFANDPSTFVLSRVLSSARQLGIDPANIRMLSVGTGSSANSVPSSYFGTVPPELWGTYQYMFPTPSATGVPSELLINLMMDGSSEIDDTQTESILTSAQYLRVQVTLTSPVMLDDCSEVPALEGMANSFVQSSKWTTIVDWVKANFV